MEEKPGIGESWQAVARKLGPSLVLAVLLWLCACAVLAAIVYVAASLWSG